MYIELCGLSGSGKTTLGSILGKKFKRIEFIKRKTKQPLLNLNLFILFKSLFPTIKIISYIFKNNIKHINLGYIKSILLCYYYYYSSFNNKNILVDHGFIQTLTQNDKCRKLLLKNKSLLKKIALIIPQKNAIYILLDIDKELSRNRAIKRGEGYHNKEQYNEDSLIINKISKFINVKRCAVNKSIQDIINDLGDFLLECNLKN